MFPREGGGPDWIPAFAGKQVFEMIAPTKILPRQGEVAGKA